MARTVPARSLRACTAVLPGSLLVRPAAILPAALPTVSAVFPSAPEARAAEAFIVTVPEQRGAVGLGRLLEADHLLADQLAVLFLLHAGPAFDEDSRLLHQHAAVSLIILGEHHDLHIPHQILQVQERHHLVVLGVLDAPVRDHAAHHHPGLVLHPGAAGLLV